MSGRPPSGESLVSTGAARKPVLVYDGDCGFCKTWLRRCAPLSGDAVAYEPYQQAAERFPDIPRSRFEKAVHLIEPDGRVTSGAEAAFRTAAAGGRRRVGLWAYKHIPGFATVSELGYALIARHRGMAGAVTWLLWGKHVEPQRFVLTRWVFLRFLALIYLVAFLSFRVQIIGLVGADGLLPISDYLERAAEFYGDAYWYKTPTIFWLGASDDALRWACNGGAVLSLLVFFRIAPGPILLILWGLYLSLTIAGQSFLSFQWDMLLLETGWLAVFFAPWRLRPRIGKEKPPSRLMLFLLWWLMFRLMVSSGLVKILFDSEANPTWLNLTALNFHYFTQPLPTWIGWYAHQLPQWFQKLSCAVMFVIEIAVPLVIFLPRRPRIVGCGLLVFLQVVILLTGNYTYFNLLTVALCLLLLDDHFLKRFFRKRTVDRLAESKLFRDTGKLRAVLLQTFFLVMFVMGTIQGMNRLTPQAMPAWTARVSTWPAPFRSINNYGLFTRMTTERPEIIVEGSNDAREWKAYEFKWKPGDLNRAPAFVAPHQPRLDWQMWFAALSPNRYASILNALIDRLFNGTPEVLALLERNPFPDEPPRYLRLVMYNYEFTDMETRNETGAWWKRDNPRVLTVRRIPSTGN